MPQGFVEVTPTQTAASWPTQYAPVQAPWNGGIQSGCTVTPKSNVEVLLYRAWGGGGKASYASRLGGWWSLQNPSAEYTDVDEWRAENAVCATFNTATTITKCTLKSGTQVIIGYTQSIYNPPTPSYAECVYPDNNTSLQVSVQNYPVDTAFVNGCEDKGSDAPTPAKWLGR
ncbi:MAG: hypothetical protein R8K20_11830 [Gallionellaceae bacterium]